MGRIRLLDEHTVNRIAAGEVIERPASVVKELVENALDAGASRIAVRVEEGGVALVSVRDDGCGMEHGDALLAFQKHATSKIRDFDDLLAAPTAGFRGEALPSIAAVARVRLTTCEPDAENGTRVLVEDNRVEAVEDIAAPTGTTVEVAELFHALPARAKHLKRPATELRHIMRAVTVLAIAHPGVGFELVHGNRTLIDAPSGDLRERIGLLLGRETARELVEVDFESPALSIVGMLAKPAITLRSPQKLFLHINRRPVQARALAYATRAAYGNLLHEGHFPVGALFLELPPDEVDANVHPAKRVVRLAHEDAVCSMLREVVERVLQEQALVTHLELGEPAPTLPHGAAALVAAPAGTVPASAAGVQAQLAVAQSDQPLPASSLPGMRPLELLDDRYIIAKGPDGVYIIDFHAAHERVMYERLRLQSQYQRVGTQELLEPLSLELSRAEGSALEQLLPELGELGFAIERFGASSFVVRSVPALLAGGGPQRVREALQEIVESGSMKSAQERHERLLYSIACHSALRAGDRLTLAQMEFVIREMASIPNPYACVHGRPTVMTITPAELDRKFKRTGF